MAHAAPDRIWQFTARPTAPDVIEGFAALQRQSDSGWLRVFRRFNNFAVGLVWGGGAVGLGYLVTWLADLTSAMARLPVVLAMALIAVVAMRRASHSWLQHYAAASLWPEDDRWTISSAGVRVENSQRQVTYTWPAIRGIVTGHRAISVQAGAIILTLPRAAVSDEAALQADIAHWRA